MNTMGLDAIPATMNINQQRYLAHIGIPVDIPTPNESRALSEIGRNRRLHAALVDWRRQMNAQGRFTPEFQTMYELASLRLRQGIAIACEVVRTERKFRGKVR